MNQNATFKLVGLSLTAFSLALIFQNCGEKFDFKSDSLASGALVTTSAPGPVTSPDAPSIAGKSGVPVTSPPQPTAPPVNPIQTSDGDVNQLVECDLGAPNLKIVLSADLKISSNEVSTRLCMTKNACLNLINSYAAERSCKLSSGPAGPGTDSKESCTAIFPGSEGTCKNAKVITDGDISALLTNMASEK